MYNTGPWSSLTDRSYLQPGDALVKHSSGGGHVVLYAGGDKWAYPTIYEAPYTGGVVRRISRYLGDEYQPRRRKALSESTLLLDNPTAKTTAGTDLGGNWTRSTSTAGYLGDNYQVRAGTTATSWARWTPRFPATGYYDVYLRWTAGWNRATNAKVTINTPEGQYVQYVDQTCGTAHGSGWAATPRTPATTRVRGAWPSTRRAPTATWWPTRACGCRCSDQARGERPAPTDPTPTREASRASLESIVADPLVATLSGRSPG